jgi:hypothetical protein
METKKAVKKRGVQLRIVERKDYRSKRATRSTLADFERFRRELVCTGHENALKVIAAGKTLRKHWAKSGAKIRVTFGCGKRALDSLIKITCNGRSIYEQTI